MRDVGERAPWRLLRLTFASLLAIGLVAGTASSGHKQPLSALESTPTPTAAATPTTTDSPTSQPTLTGYTFDDEFDGVTVGPVWTRDFNFGGTENSWSSTQSSVANGVLTITAQRSGLGWASDLLDTKTMWTQRYGYFEARMKIPKGAGLWPAFWLYYSQFGVQAEVDVMEVCANPLGANDGKDASLLLTTVHWTRGGSRGARIRTADLSLDFHVYAVEWRADHIAFFLDGVEVWRFTDVAHIPTVALPLIVDLAVGGSLCGASTALTPNPSFLQIDWVRARP
ncbi:MAG: glycoside hydrolase family 16 protein [Actinomycetota bacterium]|nr:glycoside hydrolase family 16 protein [Actinomycetota bacterium]